MSVEVENKALVRRWLKSHESGSPDVSLLGPDHVYHNAPPGVPSGQAGLEIIHKAFSDWREDIEDMVAEGDKVVVRATARFKHTGDFNGIKATGRDITRPFIQIWTIKNGKLADLWEQSDTLSFMQQLGAIPTARQ